MADRRARRSVAVTRRAASGLRKSFGGVAALDGVTLTRRAGRIPGAARPIGLRQDHAAARAGWTGIRRFRRHRHRRRDMHGVPARERGVGFVFQHYALFRHMTVARNVAFGLEVRAARAAPAAARDPRAGAVAAGPDGDRRSRRPLSRSRFPADSGSAWRWPAPWPSSPRLLLLDEPFGALDAKVRKSLRIWLRDLHDRMGLTSIFVTHDQAEAMEMADRVAVLRAGRIEQVDAPDRLYAEPASAFVHEFLGESIRLECVVEQGVASDCGITGLLLCLTDCLTGPAIALIRPHEIDLLPGAGRRRWKACTQRRPAASPAGYRCPARSRRTASDDAWMPEVGTKLRHRPVAGQGLSHRVMRLTRPQPLRAGVVTRFPAAVAEAFVRSATSTAPRKSSFIADHERRRPLDPDRVGQSRLALIRAWIAGLSMSCSATASSPGPVAAPHPGSLPWWSAAEPP